MVRPREFDEEEIKQIIMNVFWEKGYEGTSMKDLVNATGLLKGSLYGAFGDKKAMYLLALMHYDQTQIQHGIQMLRSERSLSEKIVQLFASVMDSMRNEVFAGGCLLCNASIEMAVLDSQIKQVIQGQIQRLQTELGNAIQNERPEYDQNNQLSSYVLSSYFGARVLAKSGYPINSIAEIRDQCLMSVKNSVR